MVPGSLSYSLATCRDLSNSRFVALDGRKSLWSHRNRVGCSSPKASRKKGKTKKARNTRLERPLLIWAPFSPRFFCGPGAAEQTPNFRLSNFVFSPFVFVLVAPKEPRHITQRLAYYRI